MSLLAEKGACQNRETDPTKKSPHRHKIKLRSIVFSVSRRRGRCVGAVTEVRTSAKRNMVERGDLLTWWDALDALTGRENVHN